MSASCTREGTGVKCFTGQTRLRSSRSTSGREPSKSTGNTSCSASRNGPNKRTMQRKKTDAIFIRGGTMSSTASAVVALDSLTLNIIQEIQVKASLEITFDALLEQLGPGNEVSNGT